MARTLLLIEDEAPIAELVVREFESAGWQVRLAFAGQAGLELLREQVPDVIVLDVGLPDMTGFEVCRAIRADLRTATVPVIFLTAHNEEIDRVVGLEIGADDYVGKPFGIRELVARVHAVIRRARRQAGQNNGAPSLASRVGTVEAADAPLTRGRLTIDPRRRLVLVGDQPVSLRAREFDLLLTLARVPEQVLRRSELLKTLWGYEHPSEVLTRTIDVHVRRLRQKLGDEGWRIETVKGVGYRLTSRHSAVV